jgi:hypothetical protein
MPSGTAGQAALVSFRSCRTTAAVACSACGAPAPDGGGLALLNETCPPSQNADPCQRCDDEKCCAADDACNAQPECVAIIDCFHQAVSLGDLSTCLAMHPAGALTFTQRFACREVLCTSTPACPPASPGSGIPPCDLCVISQCPDTFAELVGTPDGYDLYLVCVGSQCGPISDMSCLFTCRDMYPEAAPAFDAWFLCATQRCPSAC